MKINYITRLCLSVVILISISGCASLPSQDIMKSETANFKLPAIPDVGKAIVYVVRPRYVNPWTSGSFDQEDARVYAVSDDGKISEIGTTRVNQYIYASLDPGDYKILATPEKELLQLSDNLRGDVFINIKTGDIVYILQDLYQTGLTVFDKKTGATLKVLKDYEGKYYVKNLSLGTIK